MKISMHPLFAELPQLLISKEHLKPFPRYEDRDAWQGLPLVIQQTYLQLGEQALGKEWPVLRASSFMDYVRTGDRKRYETVLNERRKRLFDLLIAECIEGEGRFLVEIADGIWTFCEQSTWLHPAHQYVNGREGKLLPDINDQAICHVTGEIAGLLAVTYWILQRPLDRLSQDLGGRLWVELQTRVIDVYEQRSDFWWMGFTPNVRAVNNWNPWIYSNLLPVCLLFMKNEERLAQVVARIVKSLDAFIANYAPDGGCDEGATYWNVAGGSMLDCLEWLHLATAGRLQVYEQPLIQEIGRYVLYSHIADDWFVNFADGSARPYVSPHLVSRYGAAIKDERLMALGDSLRKEVVSALDYLHPIRTLWSWFRPMSSQLPKSAPLLRDVWLPDIQFMAAREYAGSAEGLYVAAKGGHNGESHNHNDIGQFIVYADGQPFLIDIGVEVYSARTFGPERYQIWTMQSAYHNLPTIRGMQQHAGQAYRAEDVQYICTDSEASFSLELAAAYPDEAGIASLKRRVALNRASQKEVIVIDAITLTTPTADVRLNLMTPVEPLIDGNTILLKAECGKVLQIQFDKNQFSVKVKRIDFQDAKLNHAWGNTLYRMQLIAFEAVRQAEWKLQIRQV
ncbi:heparinase II/III domain-containing protein [Paenibacillus roseipurpureus]|uniref:Heparinase II/III family protein n=1 Tax=Paenibacillus roseopurpureus TaxID=2918901 RepID=A0AA96RH68_9BACL|nr:heparinase II/III family protein [Paenibacillus sp. MBLB1832]WNR42993.1 heparinase II/III family protein [Paenibacillus sp. MBLB1832]